jgi:hypothetical protein
MPETLDNSTTGGEGYFEKPAKRTWPITILGLLLLLQAAGYFFIGGLHTLFIDFDWELTPQDYLIDIPLGVRGGAFIGLGLLALLAAGGFFRLRPGAWLNAVLVQGLSLLLALYLYVQEKPFYIFGLMLYSIILVLYLNYSEVRTVFQNERALTDWGAIDER